ncbi:hypothetical protein FRC00_003603 [Tulasnella sp. 408]|nr:hypothetical protein FRC00_003603 [Tulasnella sp. 408]
MTPAALRKYFTENGTAHKYNWDRPVPRHPLKVIRDWPTAKEALQNSCFTADYPANANLVFSGDNGYLQMMNETSTANAEIAFIREQFAGHNDARKHADYIFLQTINLIKTKSYNLVDNGKRSVDIVRDVLINLPTRFVADLVLGLPLKTEDHPIGTLFEHELSEKLRDIYNFIFLQNDPTTHVARRESVKETVDYLTHVTAHHWSSILSLLKFDFGILAEKTLQIVSSGHNRSHDWLRRLKLKAGGRSDRQLLNDAVSLAVLLGAEYSQLLVHCLDTFLPPNDYSAKKDGKNDAKPLFEQVAEAARQSTTDTAGRNKLLGQDYVVDTLLIPALRPILSLKALSRVQGNSGRLK